MSEYGRAAREEIAAAIDRAEFECLSREGLRVELTDSFTRRLGECRQIPASTDGGEAETTYVIRLARRLFTDRDDEQWRDTVRHEVAHAYVLERFGDGVDPHGAEWKVAARRVGANPRARYEGTDESIDPNYVLACPNGCFERGYLKRSKRVKHPWEYACSACETKLISYDAGDRPTDPTPGSCFVASISWTAPEDKGTIDAGNYVLACPNDCTAWPYQQRSKRVKYPWQYTCPECQTELISHDAGERPANPDPGTCYVKSVPWEAARYVHACPNGCFTVGYRDEQAEIRNPSEYRCNDCGTGTISYPADDRPPDPIPGNRYIDS